MAAPLNVLERNEVSSWWPTAPRAHTPAFMTDGEAPI